MQLPNYLDLAWFVNSVPLALHGPKTLQCQTISAQISHSFSNQQQKTVLIVRTGNITLGRCHEAVARPPTYKIKQVIPSREIAHSLVTCSLSEGVYPNTFLSLFDEQ